jgi:CBS domain-containing protein
MSGEKPQTVAQGQIVGLVSFVVLVVLGMVVAWFLHQFLPGSLAEAKIGDDISLKGVVPFVAFGLVLVIGAWFISSSQKIQLKTIWSAGVIKPTSVTDVAAKSIETIDIGAHKESLRTALKRGNDIVFVEKDGKLEGMITTSDLAFEEGESVEDMVKPWEEVVKVSDDTRLSSAQELFDTHSKIPVVGKDGRPIGVMDAARTLSEI